MWWFGNKQMLAWGTQEDGKKVQNNWHRFVTDKKAAE